MPRDARIRNQNAPTGPGSTLAGRWAYLESKMLDPDIPRNLRTSFRGMFYIGAYELLTLLDDHIDAGSDVISDDDVTFLDRLHEELKHVLNGD